MRDLFIIIFFGILEGITEWLPISSTGHLILLEDFLTLPLRAEVAELFEVVIQLGAILAVAVLYFEKLNPLSRKKTAAERRATRSLWGRVLLAVLPSAIAGLLLDDLLTAHLFHPLAVAVTLIFYGILFLFFERIRRAPRVFAAEDVRPCTALAIGCFQVLSLVPGTSRSGATLLGGCLLGLSTPAAAEFSFFLGIPTMCGAGLLKGVKFFAAGERLVATEVLYLALGTVISFLVSLAVIKFLLDLVRKRGLRAFGIYRILLGCAVLARVLF